MIEFSRIYKSYGDEVAVDNINFSVDEGELFGLIGPDGAGKTTLFRMLTTLILPDKGEIRLANKNVVEDFRFVRSNVGYMPGTFSLYQDLSVEENLNFFATLFNTSIEENYDLIRDIYIQIEPYKKRRAGALSGGMKQKLALSCALIHKPLVLVLDEPTTGVDAVSRKEFWEMLSRLKEGGLTILVSTAYMDEATLCDRVALIQNGQILNINTPQGIVNAFDKQLIEVSHHSKYHLLQHLQNRFGTKRVQPFGDKMHVSLLPDENEQMIKDCLLEAGIDGAEIAKGTPTVEDCFMDLMIDTHG